MSHEKRSPILLLLVNEGIMKGFVDYYRILGIDREATLEEIKQAYRSLALKYHPDKSQSEIGRIRFLEITKAYEVLKEEASRRKYNLSYDRHFSSVSQQDSYATLQRVRAKRSSRYSRSQYSQRMRYRGTATSSGEGQPFTFTQKREKKRYNSYSASYASQYLSDYENTLKAYRRVAFVMRIFIGMILIYGSYFLLDRALAHKSDPLEITKLQELRDRSGYITGIKVVTADGIFHCHAHYERQLLREKEVRIARTPWRGLISGVYVGEGNEEHKISLKREQFGFGFYSIWLLIAAGILCFIFRNDPERNFKLCSGTILLALVIYFTLFYF